jgi:hypothetical protein
MMATAELFPGIFAARLVIGTDRLHLPALPSLQAYYGPSSLLRALCLLPVRVSGTGPAARSPSRSRAGLPDSRLQPSGRSVSNHLRKLRLARARYPSAGRTKITSPFGELGASPLASRLATPHRPNRVRQPTDWPFTSCCSPPRVATTQLQSVTSYVDLERTFTSPTKCALRRTGDASRRLVPHHRAPRSRSG